MHQNDVIINLFMIIIQADCVETAIAANNFNFEFSAKMKMNLIFFGAEKCRR